MPGSPSPRILFLTGRLAEANLRRVLAEWPSPPFRYEIRQIGLQVAGLMTADLIKRRLSAPVDADQIMVPGRCRGDLDELGRHFGMPVVRGPEELKDLPVWFGAQARRIDLRAHSVCIFAEIVDAPQLSVAAIVARAQTYRSSGADVIDLGCLPATPFAHLAESVQELKRQGHGVSIDSLEPQDLLTGAMAGADYLLSLKPETLWIADEVAATPIVISDEARDYASLARVVRQMLARGRRFLADPILQPIHFGFTESITRYHRLRQEFPEAGMMMGIGNLTELTDADTSGMHALLLGIISELGIQALLTTEVSAHARGAVREIDCARRIMYAASADHSLPKGYSDALLIHRDKQPFPDTLAEVQALARAVKDPSYRIQVTEEGVHIYNRDGLHSAIEPFALYPHLQMEHNAGHAFYLGVELARAHAAWQLGKRYVQDQPLQWGCAVQRDEAGLSEYSIAGHTLHKPRETGT